MTWTGSTRRSRLPKDWPRRVRLVLQRDPTCKLHYAHICTTNSTEVDHIIAGDDHRLAALQGVCHPCHQRKTNTERPSIKRAPAPHPGLR